MNFDDNENLVRIVESLNCRVRNLELLLAAIFAGIGFLAFRSFGKIPSAQFIDALLGGTAVGLLLMLLYWGAALLRWMKRVGVPGRWCGRLVGALGAASLAGLIPIAIDWLHS